MAHAAPEGGRVSAGTAAITRHGKIITVTQISSRAVIDWRGFDIRKDEIVLFDQPDNHASVLNRVGGSTPSIIAGQLLANGNIVISNPNGVVYCGMHDGKLSRRPCK